MARTPSPFDTARVLTVDQLSVQENLAINFGPLIGPCQVEQFIALHFCTA